MSSRIRGSIRGSYTFSSLANFLAGVYNNAGFTQTFGAAVVAQTNPNVGVYLQDEWKAGPGFTMNAGLRYDLQFLQTIATDANNLAPRVGSRGRRGGAAHGRPRQRWALLRSRAAARARQCYPLGGNTTNLANVRQKHQPVPDAAGAPAFPNILSAAVPSVTLAEPHDDEPEHAERVFPSGERGGRGAAWRSQHDQRG